MTEDELIQALQKLASSPENRTDFASSEYSNVSGVLTSNEIDSIEGELGYRLFPLYRRILEEVGNGGFGPGYGLLGLKGGYQDQGLSAVDLSRRLWETKDQEGLPRGFLPLCNWGDGVWSCINSHNGGVYTLSENLTVAYEHFRRFLEHWVAGEPIWNKMFRFEDRVVTNPFTKRQITTRVPIGPAIMAIDSNLTPLDW